MDTNQEREQRKNDGNSDYYLKGIRQNNPTIIREIYTKYSLQVIKMVEQNNGDVEDAKDVFQDVMISLFNQVHNGLVIRCTFSAFIMMACKRRWMNVLNSKYMSKTKNMDDYSTSILIMNDEVNDFSTADEKLKLLNEKLKMLDVNCREIIEQSWQSDDNGKYKSWNEIALNLQISYAYIRKRAAECKKRLIELAKKDRRFLDLK
ncbi:MAG: sigma-70 family RNA polymerase sigma factor [Saprospiraceae bacterium]|nr:sigma-70 family RNA polymerase sigma factor [Saprospiraceae bacterium]